MAKLFKVYLLIFIITVISFSCEKEKDPVVKSVVINELMSVNTTIIADQNGN